MTLPASWYHGADLYERERRAIFGSEWLYFAPAARVAATGDYVAANVCGWDIVVVVGTDGVRRAFHNVCRHRAGPLVGNGVGHRRAFVCGYHGWAYELDGRLRSARDFGAEVDADACSLIALRVEEWRGLLFVNLDETAPPLLESLGGFAVACESFAMEAFGVHSELAHEIECNWKTYADNYLEGYHIPLVHPQLMKEIDVRSYRVEVGDRWCVHSAEARDGAPMVGKWLWRFPNLALNLYPDGMNVERFVPLGPTRMRVEYTYFFAVGAEEGNSVESSRRLLEEDARICETVQRRLEAGAYETGQLSPRHEQAVAAFQSWVRAAVEDR